MNLIKFCDSGQSQFDVAILIKDTSFSQRMLENYYSNPLVLGGIPETSIMAASLMYHNNKVTKSLMSDHIESLKPVLKTTGIKYILCADSNYYKFLTKQSKAEANLDRAVPCTVPELEHIQVIYTVNYSSLAYNPNQTDKIDLANNTVIAAYSGSSNRISLTFKDERYPVDTKSIKKELDRLHQFDELGVDIETFSLRLGEAGIASIAFATDIDKGVAFLVDYKPVTPESGNYGVRKTNHEVRALLKEFLDTYEGNITFHGGSYDLKQLVWELYMEHPLDHKNMVDGALHLTRNWDDSRIIAFLCKNSTTRPDLTLKGLAYEYAGDYGEENIKNVLKIDPFQLLRYNLTDSCCTLWVKDKYWDQMFMDQQEHVYQDFLDMQRVLLVTELHGMPMDEDRRIEVDDKLNAMRDAIKERILESNYVLDTEEILIQREVEKANAKLKKLKKSADDFDDLQFNPGSSTQLQVLLHKVLQLPVLKLTPAKEPKTDADTLKLLIHQTEDEEVKGLLKDIIDYSEICTVINTFMKAFSEGMLKADGRRYLHGSFNIAKVKSGRLSSSDPNLQNLPAGSTYGKLIKSIFAAPDGKIWTYSDFNSLEDYISALLSKDTNKMKVYLGHEIFEINTDNETFVVRDDSEVRYHGELIKVRDFALDHCTNNEVTFPFNKQYDELYREVVDLGKGSFIMTKIGNSSKYDGHSIRAFSYFPHKLPGIVDNIKSINSIKDLFDPVRGESKGPTFMLTYGGSEHGLSEKFGFTKKEAKAIYDNYHTLYVESDEYVQKRIDEAAQLGYIVLAFGLRLRCPLLQNTIRKSSYQARGTSEDERTLGNAIGQSYGQLNNRAMVAFMNHVWNSKYKYEIFPIAPIHDASYYVSNDDLDAIMFINKYLITEMQWQEDPLIAHDRVKIGAELDVAYPSWAYPFTIPNGADDKTITELKEKHLAKLKKDGVI